MTTTIEPATPATDADIERWQGSLSEGSYKSLSHGANHRLIARIKADAEKLAEYQGIVQRLEEEAEKDAEKLNYLRTKGNWSLWATAQGWLPPDVVAKVESCLLNIWGASLGGSAFEAWAKEALTAIRSAKGATPNPRTLTTEEIAELAAVGANVNALKAELDGLRKLVARQEVDIRNIAGACDNLAADVEALENTAKPEPAVPVSVLREALRAGDFIAEWREAHIAVTGALADALTAERDALKEENAHLTDAGNKTMDALEKAEAEVGRLQDALGDCVLAMKRWAHDEDNTVPGHAWPAFFGAYGVLAWGFDASVQPEPTQEAQPSPEVQP